MEKSMRRGGEDFSGGRGKIISHFSKEVRR
jgi:hypothetical protein